jgi:hypothetical protein
MRLSTAMNAWNFFPMSASASRSSGSVVAFFAAATASR